MNNNFYEIPNDWYNEFGNNFLNSISSMPGNNMQNDASITNPKEAIERGNLFNNLYESYKNYKYRDLKANTKKEELLLNIMALNFVLTEMDLYLDTNPGDGDMLSRYNKYLFDKKKLVDEYQQNYGPLMLDGFTGRENKFTWVNTPWPWEGSK